MADLGDDDSGVTGASVPGVEPVGGEAGDSPGFASGAGRRAPSTAVVENRELCLRLVGPSLQDGDDITPATAWAELDSCGPETDAPSGIELEQHTPGEAGVCELNALYFVVDADQADYCVGNPKGPGCTGCNPDKALTGGGSAARTPIFDHPVLVGWSVSAGHGPPGYAVWGGLGWRLFVAQPRKAAFEELDNLVFSLTVAFMIFLAIIFAVSAFMTGWIVRPLEAVSNYLRAIQLDRLDEPPPVIQSADEVGRMARAATDVAARIRRRMKEYDEKERQANEREADLRKAVADLVASAENPGRCLVYHAFIAESRRGIIALDDAERVVAVNGKASELLHIPEIGPDQADLPGLADVLRGDHLSSVRDSIERGRRGVPSEEVLVERLDGGVVRVRVTTRPIVEHTGIGGIAIYLEDASQKGLRKRYEALIDHFAQCESACGDELDCTANYRTCLELLEMAKQHGETRSIERLQAIGDALASCAEGQRALRAWNDGDRTVSLRAVWEKVQRAQKRWPETAVCKGLERVHSDLESALDRELQRD